MEEGISKSGFRGMFKRIADFIGKDVKAQNESKKLIVAIRLLLISVIVYFSLNAILIMRKLNFAVLLLFVVFFCVFTGLFAASYFCKSITTLWVFNAGMLVWICFLVHFFGWNIGVQHFIMVLLVLCFFSSYKQYIGKILYAVSLCIFRIFLFYIYHAREPLWPLVPAEENILQIINTITIFWCISAIAFIFSNDCQELESKLVDYNAQLEKQANTDALTGLYNRRKAVEYMKRLMVNQSNYTGFSLCICDIDFFKKVNDEYGHDIGDEVLKSISKIFMEEKKKGNFVARWGGEEFLIVFPKCNGDDAFIKLEGLRRKVKEMRVQGNNHEIGVTMTFGLTEYDFNNDLTAILKEADKKLYQGKEQGRDRIIF